MHRTMRVGAYGLLTDDRGRHLLQRGTTESAYPGAWWVPGGKVDHGEDPADTVVREFAEETGLAVEVTGTRAVRSAVVSLTTDWQEHNTLIVYDVKAAGGSLSPDFELGACENLWRYSSEIDGQAMSPITSTMLQLEDNPLPPSPTDTPPEPDDGPLFEQRVGAYAWITDSVGQVLLTMVPPGYWASGRWHLPGGGVDFGERPQDGLAREVHEETNQDVVLGELRCVASRHDRDSVAPGGRPSNFHGIAIVYDAMVPEPKPLEILDIGGSTSEVRWFPVDQIAELPQTFAVTAALAASH